MLGKCTIAGMTNAGRHCFTTLVVVKQCSQKECGPRNGKRTNAAGKIEAKKITLR